jgi:hypothetical protein
MSCLSYCQFDHIAKAKIYWEVVLLVAAVSLELSDNMGLHRQISLVYLKFIFVLQEKIPDALSPHFFFDHNIDLQKTKYST